MSPAAEVGPLTLGPIVVDPPVVLAPMAGITNAPFRRLCRRFGAGLFVSEMITARGLVEGNARSWEMVAFDADESPRSIQLYGADPVTMAAAVARLVDEERVDHLDLNLGCPVRKITRHGGGAAICAHPRLLAALLGAAVGAAGAVPVTVKFRLGIDADVATYLDTGRIAEDAGCAAVALHARTAAQLYSGQADWSAIARLKEVVTSIPVLGNGDVWEAADARRMLDETGADGVVVGRGCLGRPWLFRDLVDVFAGREPLGPPPLGEVVDVLAEHADLLVDRFGEDRALRDLRKHIGWYLHGYPVGGAERRLLQQVQTRDQLHEALAGLDRHASLPAGTPIGPRGTTRGPQSVSLPDRWLDERDSDASPGLLADALTSGG